MDLKALKRLKREYGTILDKETWSKLDGIKITPANNLSFHKFMGRVMKSVPLQ